MRSYLPALVLAGFLLLVLTFNAGLRLGYVEGLSEETHLERLDRMCRYEAQSVLIYSLWIVEDELDEWRLMHWVVNEDKSEDVILSVDETVDKKRHDELEAKQKRYYEQLEQIQEVCDATLAELSKK